MSIKYPSAGDEDPRRRHLGDWVSTQRSMYHSRQVGNLSPTKIIKLEHIPGWSWSVHLDAWNAAYADLLKLVKKNGKLPSRKSSKEKILGNWIKFQRRACKESRLSADQIIKIEQIPGWSWNPYSDQWDATYINLFDFVQKNNRIPSCESAHSREQSLTRWVLTQRKTYKRNKLSSTRVNKLKQIPGWIWDPFPHRWNSSYEKLRAFVRQNNKLPDSRSKNLEGILGKWIFAQRRKYKKHKLSPEQIKKIEQIPDWAWEFVNTADENKKKLLRMARDRNPRPNSMKTKLGQALGSYTGKGYSSSYDPEFDKQIRVLAPHWFRTVA